jgi:hypothetical protein
MTFSRIAAICQRASVAADPDDPPRYWETQRRCRRIIARAAYTAK